MSRFKVWTVGDDENEATFWVDASDADDAVREYFDEEIGLEEASAVGCLGDVAVDDDSGTVTIYHPSITMRVYYETSLKTVKTVDR